MFGFLILVVLVLAVFALIGSIWGKDTAQGCFGVSVFVVLALVALVILFVFIIAFTTRWS